MYKRISTKFICYILITGLIVIGIHSLTLATIKPAIYNIQENHKIQQGQRFYQAGKFREAAEVWQAAEVELQSKKDDGNHALVLSYLGLVYQQLGQSEQAQIAIESAGKLAKTSSQSTDFLKGQILNIKGQLELAQGKPQKALETWEDAEEFYQVAQDSQGIIGTKINQSRALQMLGFYRRARKNLEEVEQRLLKQSESSLKAVGLLNLGNVLRVTGYFKEAQSVLEQSLAAAQKIQSLSDIQIAYLNLGKLAFAQQKYEQANNYYQQANIENSSVKLSAQLNLLEGLIAINKTVEAEKIQQHLQAEINLLPPNQHSILARIALAKTLMKLEQNDVNVGKMLGIAVKQAEDFGDVRLQSYALGQLGQLYEKNRQFSEAQTVTESALILANKVYASDIAYQWQWQLGRILQQQGEKSKAIENYTASVKNLGSLRNDLVAISQDAQFSFREQVEPVYRELVNLLLQDQNPSQFNLNKAREVIESLQIAELTNYFREACLDNQTESIDNVDANTAVIYPIILPNQLSVIVSLPGKPLRYYSTVKPEAELEAAMNQMRQSLRSTSFLQERLTIAQKLYNWLIQPAINDLTKSKIKTLVFVLDGSLRNLPMAALHDGKQYLIEKYSLAITPSLKLFRLKSLSREKIGALVGGISENTQNFPALPGVKQEIRDISNQVPAEVLLNQTLTNNALIKKIKQLPFTILHLATHGQFSSNPEQTFIVTWDGKIKLQEFDQLIANREINNNSPIELLVLSACETAKGDKRAALGIAGVAVRSGARSTVATLWLANDESTAEFMAKFYELLTQPEMTRAEAIQQAQLHLLKQPQYQHPFYWATFILVGSWL
ncbi:CHAT domain-containing protein [Anabaena sp. UHCC 0451]|uniref:CHAT domain-containing protein n=1 Tax=Anabaena sp. UHCC 0451 TaxID=2055235 RepID=UPI002B200DDB|nr:CHAT domain-containing protein [Anabaena sp. UHCC 0451]MEA5575682.1 CHAT domain-containing protein [Anabaena sp. UHCC 0451]